MSPSSNPFRALSPFKREDRDLLFGRDGDLTVMMDRLMSRRATLLFAASGVGKTSFLNAKVIPDLEDRYLICSHSQWAAEKPLEAVAISLAKTLKESGWGKEGVSAMPPSEDPDFSLLRAFSRSDLYTDKKPIGSILILDQFEEVFQYHKDMEYFALFIDQLSELINAPTPEVRVVFAMREEFLGELSVFDNKISDLFNNYYRLKNPSKRQARDIIKATTRSVDVEPSDSLSLLVDDLLSASSTLNSESQNGSRNIPGSHTMRDYVPPPYLQIACYRLWRRTVILPSDGRSSFPAFYQPGDASRELELYCRENLDSLSLDQQNLICDALGFLMTSQGAKMAYELSNLAQHMGLSREGLRAALEQLSRPRVRILRQFSAPDGSIWFELYHDMYAPFLCSWKFEFQRVREEMRLAQELENERQHAEERARRAEAEGRAEEEKRQRADAERSLLQQAQALAEEQRQRAEEQRQRAEEQRQRADEKVGAAKRLKILAIALAISLLAAVIGLGFAFYYSQLARSRELAAEAMEALNFDPELGLLLSLQAIGMGDSPEANESLHHAIESLQVRLTLIDPSSSGPVFAVAFNPLGSIVATTGDDKTARLWDVNSGQLIRKLSGHTGRVMAVAFSPDGRRLATAGQDNTAKLWDVDSGEELRTFSGHAAAVAGVAFSPDGKTLATGSFDKTAKLWDVDSGLVLKTISGHTAAVTGVAFSPNGKILATGSDDWTASLWDAASGQELVRYPRSDANSSGHSDKIFAVAFSPDGKRLITGSADGTTKVWDALVDFPLQKAGTVVVRATPIRTLSDSVKTTLNRSRSINAVAFDATGYLIATASADGAVKLWNSRTGEVQLTLTGHSGGADAIAFAPDGEAFVTAGQDGMVRVWNINSGGEIFSVGHDAYNEVAFSANGRRIATAGEDNVVEIRDASGNELRRLVKHSQAIWGLAFDPTGERVASASLDGTVNIWDVLSGEVIRTLPEETSKEKRKFSCVAFSPDGRTIAAGAVDGTITVWNQESSTERLFLLAHDGQVSALAFSPDGNLLAAARANATAEIWDVSSGKQRLRLSGHKDALFGIAFSLDGTRLATGSRDQTAKLWDVQTGRELLTFSGHTNSVTSVAFILTPDALKISDRERLVTSSWDGTVKLWNTSSGAEQSTLSSPTPVMEVAVSPDGKRLATANWDGVLRLYSANFEDLAAQAAKVIGRPLTDQECKKYLHATEKCSETTAPAALRLVEQGVALARVGDIRTAVDNFREAQRTNRAFKFDPEREAHQLRADVLVTMGRNLAANGDAAGARERFSAALALDPDLAVDPVAEARFLVARGRVAAGETLVRRGEVIKAIEAYKEAQQIDPLLTIEASSWNTLCWEGALWGHAPEVMPACQQAVNLSQGDWNIGDSLGVAMVLTGEGSKAISLFQTFAAKTGSQNYRQRRLEWIKALKIGQNPLTSRELEWLAVN